MDWLEISRRPPDAACGLHQVGLPWNLRNHEYRNNSNILRGDTAPTSNASNKTSGCAEGQQLIRATPKVIVVDERTMISGSHNFTSSAECDNDEKLVIVDDPSLARAYLDEFERVYAQAQAPTRCR